MKNIKNDNVFRNRNFRLVFFGALVSELGALLYNFAVSFYILRISGNSAFLQGLYLALCGVALLVFTPVGGVLGDRFNKAKTFVPWTRHHDPEDAREKGTHGAFG